MIRNKPVLANRFVVVAIVAKDGSKIANNVDDEEDGSLFGSHGEIRSAGIALDGMFPCSLHQKIKDSGRAPKNLVGSVGGEGEHEENNKNDHSVGVIGQKCSLDTAKHGVEYDTNWKEEAGRNSGHASELLRSL